MPRHASQGYQPFPVYLIRTGALRSAQFMQWVAFFVFAALLSTLMVSMPALAQGLKYPGYWINPTSDEQGSYGHHQIALSITGYHGENPEYCIELINRYIIPVSWSSRVVDTTDYKIAASMVAAHQSDHSDDVQAAVSYAIHEHLDATITPDRLRKLTDAGLEGGDINRVRQLAAQYWADATVAAHQTLSSSYEYRDCEKNGVIKVFATNASGGYASGVPFSIQTSGPIAVTQTSGSTTNGVLEIPWVASGNGSAAYTVTYSDPIVNSSHSEDSQDIIRFEGEQGQTVPEIRFDVTLPYQPTVSSAVPNVRVERGAVPLDTIVMGMKESGTWPEGARTHVEGSLYGPFASKKEADEPGRWVDSALRATASHDFGAPGQSYTLRQQDVTPTQGSLTDLPTGWYRWVWRIIKDHQEPAAKRAMLADYVDDHDTDETIQVIHAMQVDLASQASAKTATPGQKLWDDVTLSVKDVSGDGRVDTHDWLHRTPQAGQKADSAETQIPLTLVGGLYMVPGALPTSGSTLPPNAVKVADARIVTTNAGTFRADGTVSQSERAAGVSEDTLTMKTGYSMDNLPAGSYWWQWSVRNADQKAARDATGHVAAADYPLEHDVAMKHADPNESTEVLRMQPTVASSVTQAYENAQAFGTVDGEYSGDHSAVSVITAKQIPWLGSAKAQRVEKGRRLLDTVTVGLDPTVSHNTWYTVADAEGNSANSPSGAAQPVTVRVKGTLYGPLSMEEAKRIISSQGGGLDQGGAAQSGTAQSGVAESGSDAAQKNDGFGLAVAARAVLDVSQPGTFTVDGRVENAAARSSADNGTAAQAGEVSDTVTPSEGFDMSNPASGWYLWQWSIANADQSVLASQTKRPIQTNEGKNATVASPAYPFLHDVMDRLGSEDENIIVPTMPTLTSLVTVRGGGDGSEEDETTTGSGGADSKDADSEGTDSEGAVRTIDEATGLLGVKLGASVADMVNVEPGNEGDSWLQWVHESQVQGVDSSIKPISVRLRGSLYAIDEEKWQQLKDDPLDAVPDWAGKPVATRRIENVDHFGSYAVEPVHITKPGLYVWYWQLEPDLETADHMTNEAWAQWTHNSVHHAFGLASESFVARRDVKDAGCSIRTEASDDVPVGGEIHDTAIITCLEGTRADQIPTRIDFPLYRQAAGADANADTLVTVIQPSEVDASAFPKDEDGFVTQTTTVRVESAKTVLESDGTYYFAERGYVGDVQGFQGTQRCENETVATKELAQTGASIGTVAFAFIGCAGAGLALRWVMRRSVTPAAEIGSAARLGRRKC